MTFRDPSSPLPARIRLTARKEHLSMSRKVFDRLTSGGGLVLVVVLAVAGGC